MMNIVFTIDKDYIQHMFVTLKSVVENTSTSVCVYIVNQDLEEQHEEKIREYFQDVVFHFIKVNPKSLFSLGINTNHLPVEVLFRLLFAKILPENLEKVLFIDADIVVRADLSEVYKIDVTDYPIAAVVDIINDVYLDLGLKSITDYFNAGLMLINLSYWRNNDLTERFIRFSMKYSQKLRYADQDVLNGVINGHWLRLSSKWNVFTNMFESPGEYIDYFGKEKYQEIITSPSLIHFTGGSKPWHISSDNPYKNEYYECLAATPFKDFKVVSETVQKLIETKSDIYIWGAGSTGEKVYNYLKIPVKGFVDSNPKRIGQNFLSKPIYSIDQIEKTDSIGILVCSGFYRHIADSLQKKGYQESIDFVHQM